MLSRRPLQIVLVPPVALSGVLAACSSPSSAMVAEAGVASAADASAADATRDGDSAMGVGTQPDGEAQDTGCQPMNVSTFQPPDYPSTAAATHVCDGFNGDGGLVTAFGDACLGITATYETCAAFAAPDSGAAAACYGCLVTLENPEGGIYGAVVRGTIPVVNYAQCIELADPDGGAGCAETLYRAAACAEFACQSTCPVTDEVSQQAFVACTNEALSGACVSYGLPALICEMAEQGDGGTPVATECFAGSTPEDHYLTIARYLCGAN